MIRINLLPTKETARAASQRQEISLASMALVLLVLVFVFLTIAQHRRQSRLDREIADVQQALTALDAKVKDVADLDQKKKDLDSKLKVIADLSRKRIGPSTVLRDLGRSIPDRAWLSEFTELKGSATLTGLAIDNQTIAQFLRDLSKSSYFTNVDLVETTQSDAGETRIRKFILKAQINYAATVKADKTSETAVKSGGETAAVAGQPAS
jgi:type IV pilus assembly protein PilN